MWSVVNKEANTFGIQGYEAAKKYIDHKKIKIENEAAELNLDVWAGKKHYPKPKLNLDAEGKPIIPTKINYIDEHLKQVNANFSQKKFDAFVEALKEKGKTLEDVERIKIMDQAVIKDPNKAKFYKHDRKTYLADIIDDEKKKLVIPEGFAEIVEKIKEKHGRYGLPELSVFEKNKIKYKGKGSTSKSDRVTFLADSMHLGEKIPFYNTHVPDNEGSDDKRGRKQKVYFYPKHDLMYKKSPEWKMKKSTEINRDYIEKRDEQQKQKAESVRQSWDNRKIKFIDDVATSFSRLENNRKYFFQYMKVNIFIFIFLSLLKKEINML